MTNRSVGYVVLFWHARVIPVQMGDVPGVVYVFPTIAVVRNK